MPSDTVGPAAFSGQPTDPLPNCQPRARVLLVGQPGFCRSVVGTLPTVSVKVVGHAHTVDSAMLAAESLLPDLALLEVEMSDVAHRLSEWTGVVIVSTRPVAALVSGGRDDVTLPDVHVLPLVIELASVVSPVALSTSNRG